MVRTEIDAAPEEAMIRVLGTAGFALGLLLAIASFVM